MKHNICGKTILATGTLKEDYTKGTQFCGCRICRRCGTALKEQVDLVSKVATEKLGISYGGSWRCPKCYPDKKGYLKFKGKVEEAFQR